MKQFNFKKGVQLTVYLTKKKGGRIKAAEALKLVWLADRFHMREFGRTITGDQFFACRTGIMPESLSELINNKLREKKDEEIYMRKYLERSKDNSDVLSIDFDGRLLSETDKTAADRVVEATDTFSENDLSACWHFFPEMKFFKSQNANDDELKVKVDLKLLFEDIEEIPHCIRLTELFRKKNIDIEIAEDLKIPYTLK